MDENTIIPGIKDGLKASGRTDEPPIILRSHDTDGPRVLRESLPLYKNIYTMTNIRVNRSPHMSREAHGARLRDSSAAWLRYT